MYLEKNMHLEHMTSVVGWQIEHEICTTQGRETERFGEHQNSQRQNNSMPIWLLAVSTLPAMRRQCSYTCSLHTQPCRCYPAFKSGPYCDLMQKSVALYRKAVCVHVYMWVQSRTLHCTAWCSWFIWEPFKLQVLHFALAQVHSA